jgi:hypothetical protein
MISTKTAIFICDTALWTVLGGAFWYPQDSGMIAIAAVMASVISYHMVREDEAI